jgi:hypothetical protein
MDAQTVNRFECYDCGENFASASEAPSCPSCGCAWTLVASLPEIVAPAASQEAGEKNNTLPAVREVLRGLCSRSYDVTFQGTEWENLVEKALQELRPYLKTKKEAA